MIEDSTKFLLSKERSVNIFVQLFLKQEID